VKDALELGPKGVRALAALCHHVVTHGTFAKEGKELARILLEALGATEDVREWLELDLGKPAGARPHSIARMRAVLEELRRSRPAPPPEGGDG
jgi:hypothetical protein